MINAAGMNTRVCALTKSSKVADGRALAGHRPDKRNRHAQPGRRGREHHHRNDGHLGHIG